MSLLASNFSKSHPPHSPPTQLFNFLALLQLSKAVRFPGQFSAFWKRILLEPLHLHSHLHFSSPFRASSSLTRWLTWDEGAKNCGRKVRRGRNEVPRRATTMRARNICSREGASSRSPMARISCWISSTWPSFAGVVDCVHFSGTSAITRKSIGTPGFAVPRAKAPSTKYRDCFETCPCEAWTEITQINRGVYAQILEQNLHCHSRTSNKLTRHSMRDYSNQTLITRVIITHNSRICVRKCN